MKDGFFCIYRSERCAEGSRLPVQVAGQTCIYFYFGGEKYVCFNMDFMQDDF